LSLVPVFSGGYQEYLVRGIRRMNIVDVLCIHVRNKIMKPFAVVLSGGRAEDEGERCKHSKNCHSEFPHTTNKNPLKEKRMSCGKSKGGGTT
jgi:hypothetical protein